MIQKRDICFLKKHGRTDMGQQFISNFYLPVLNIGAILAIFDIPGNTLSLREFLKICLNGCLISSNTNSITFACTLTKTGDLSPSTL